MCRVEDLSVKLRQRRLRWILHVKRGERGVLGDVGEVRVGGGDIGQEGLGKSGVSL